MKNKKIITIVCNSLSEKIGDKLKEGHVKNIIVLNTPENSYDEIFKMLYASLGVNIVEYDLELVFDPMVQCELNGLTLTRLDYFKSITIKLMNYREFLNEYVVSSTEDSFILFSHSNTDMKHIVDEYALNYTDNDYTIDFMSPTYVDCNPLDVVLSEQIKKINRIISEKKKTGGKVILPIFDISCSSQKDWVSFVIHNTVASIIKEEIKDNIIIAPEIKILD